MLLRTVMLLSVATLAGCKDHTRLVPALDAGCDPFPEICDGRDNDCDGTADLISQPCSSVCGAGVSICRDGEWSSCSARSPEEERCDAIDNDCDGLVDNSLPIVPCYPRGNRGELLYGDCRIGIERCTAGITVCHGWVGPDLEICDGKDNDCDGTVDEGMSGALDLVFAIDYSCSMISSINDLKNVTMTWSAKYTGRGDLRFALLGVPPPNTSYDGKVIVLTDFVSPEKFSAELSKHNVGNGAYEPTLDAIYLAGRNDNPLRLTWVPRARHAMVIYTDEEPQSHMTPMIDESSAAAAAMSTDMHVYVFSNERKWTTTGWNIYPMWPITLERDLDQVISKGSCQ